MDSAWVCALGEHAITCSKNLNPYLHASCAPPHGRAEDLFCSIEGWSTSVTCAMWLDRHVESLWFANVSNQLMWWAYVKAFLRSLLSRVCCCFMRIVRAHLHGKTPPNIY